MKEFKIVNFNEQVLACRSLIVAARNVSIAMEKFIQWVFAGVLAGLAYFLAHQKVPFGELKPALWAFVAGGALGVIQRYLAMIVAIGSQVFQEAEKLHDEKRPIDLARFLIVYIQAQPRFSRWAAAGAARRLMAGNIVGTGRTLLKISIWQTFLGLGAIALLVLASLLALSVFNNTPFV
jgi:hypothetical protein